MIGALSIGLAAAALAGQPEGEQVSPMIDDIIAGYHAWDLSCEPAGAQPPISCRTQASDQVTTIRLYRTAHGLDISLGTRRCPDSVGDARATFSADQVRPRRRRHDSERLSRVYSRFVRLEYQLLESCGAKVTTEPSPVYHMLMIRRFLQQSDVVIAGDRN